MIVQIIHELYHPPPLSIDMLCWLFSKFLYWWTFLGLWMNQFLMLLPIVCLRKINVIIIIIIILLFAWPFFSESNLLVSVVLAKEFSVQFRSKLSFVYCRFYLIISIYLDLDLDIGRQQNKRELFSCWDAYSIERLSKVFNDYHGRKGFL